MLRRSPLNRKTPLRPKRKEPGGEREPRPMALSPASRRGSYSGGMSGEAVGKEAPVRSEAYRRLVAAMPCSCGCGRQPCQAAHPNTGKGMGLKTDDRLCFPLAPPCHSAFDQGAMFPKQARRQWELAWGEQTRAAITAAGLWPANLPKWTEES